ncbi:MAG TPA: class II glutamine amidotransferase [Candidatus Dormibacteraeota bacterium]|nr:class II glutamine amidotransferase [Candidatus Dormibacteraeota bacterium]
MCELFVARADEPFAIGDLWGYAERLERFGIAGFGWGAAWVAGDGRLGTHRDVRAMRDDGEAVERVGAVETTAVLVHLRRPSRLSTLGMADTQPFPDPGGRFAFSHNGDLSDWKPWRRRYQAEGRIAGRADSEVAARWLEDAWRDGEPAELLLAALHDAFGGEANLGLLDASGRPSLYAGNPENPVFTFSLGRIRVASTGIYSLDRSLFRYVARGATDRRLVPLHRTVSV